MKTMFPDSAHGGAVRTGQPAWRRALAIMLIALLSPVPALLAFWADASGDWQPDSWVDPASGHVFTLAELDAFSDDIDGDGLSNAQEMSIGTNPFSPDTDGDGISDLLDPLPLTASNLNPANGIIWGAIALDDADGDGIPNFLDDYPYGQYGGQLGTPDTDGDGIPDFIDPAPEDPYNTSPFNGLQWLGDALANADGDGVPNFHDWYPYDSALWDPQQDPDGDGLVKAKDPHPADPYNPSPVNGVNWGTEVYGDADGDGIPNFYDAYPYDSGNGYVTPEPDSDGDGIPDTVDPSPWDYDNFSAANGVSWQGDARGDADGDGISNFYDQFPYDYYNGNVPVFDQDGDGIPDAEDPAPTDPTNLSPVNGGLWYTAALADADGDGNPNFTDPWPYDSTNGNLPPEWDSPTADTDGDGIPNAQDPALADPMNFSIYNGTSWYGAANGDVDGDGIVNFQDAYPYDYYNGSYAGPDSDGDGMPDSSDPYPNDPNNGNGDADGDGIVDSQDPYPYDATNGSGGTGGGGDPQPEPDTDGDGRPDSQDPYPNDPYDNADFDQDGIPDVSDPAQADRNNHSSFNGVEWYADVRGDADGDTILNFWDLEPYGPTPVDTDGDGMLDSIDPALEDPYNFSAYNKTIWSSDALGDADGDGIPNYFDTWPYDSLNGTGDADMDGLPDASDPVPEDPYNNSSHNGAMWSGTSALGDVDNDGILNYFDAYPDDPYDGLPPGGDADGDGIPNEQDPDPRNGTNTSPYNGINWGEGANGDADNDGTANYWDYTPFGDDRDGDGIRDDLDPAPDDWTNYCEANQREWYADALGDNDLDYDLNFYDPEPDGGPPREPDVPQPSASASPLVILNDGYDELGVSPDPGVTPDRDMADVSLAIKAGSRAGKMAISRLSTLNLSLPTDYVNAGGSVTFTQSGAGFVRLHAVRMVDGEGVEDREISMGVPYVPPDDGTWVHLIESVSGGGVTLTCHFPWLLYGETTSGHPSGTMSSDVDVNLTLESVLVKIVNRDDPTKTWTTGPVSSGPIAYTSPTIPEVDDVRNGDLISWSVPGLTSGSFQWWATGPSGSRKDAPVGTDNEWKLDDPLDWLPGKWRIHCRYTPSGGAVAEFDFEQNLGYRSPDVTVIGWIDGEQINLPKGTDMVPDPSYYGLSYASVMDSFVLRNGFLLDAAVLSGSSPLWATPHSPDGGRKYVNAYLIKSSPNNAPPAEFQLYWPGSKNRKMVDDAGFTMFKSQTDKFRSFQRFQARFELDDSGKIKGEPHYLKQTTQVGVTPVDWLPDPAGETGPYDGTVNTNGTSVMFNPKSGKTYSANLADDFEQYTQGRISTSGTLSGGQISQRLNNLTVPWIWSLIEFGVAHAKAGTTAIPEHEIFPVYHVYYNGRRIDPLTNSISEAKMEEFIQLGGPIMR